MLGIKIRIFISNAFHKFFEKVCTTKIEQEIFGVIFSFEYPRLSSLKVRKIGIDYQLWFGGVHFCDISQDHQRLLITCVSDNGPQIFVNNEVVFKGLSKFIQSNMKFSIQWDLRYVILRKWYLMVD